MTDLDVNRIAEKLDSLTGEIRSGDSWLDKVLAGRSLPQWARLAEHAGVRQARSEGLTWGQIAAELGLTRQGAWQLYGADETAEPDDEDQEKPKRRPRPIIKLNLSEAEILEGILDELDSRPAQALSRAISERIAELMAAMAGDDVDPIKRTGFGPTREKPPAPKLGQVKDWPAGTLAEACRMSGHPSLFPAGEKKRCPACGNLVLVRTDKKWMRHQPKPVPNEVVRRAQVAQEQRGSWTETQRDGVDQEADRQRKAATKSRSRSRPEDRGSPGPTRPSSATPEEAPRPSEPPPNSEPVPATTTPPTGKTPGSPDRTRSDDALWEQSARQRTTSKRTSARKRPQPGQPIGALGKKAGPGQPQP